MKKEKKGSETGRDIRAVTLEVRINSVPYTSRASLTKKERTRHSGIMKENVTTGQSQRHEYNIVY